MDLHVRTSTEYVAHVILVSSCWKSPLFLFLLPKWKLRPKEQQMMPSSWLIITMGLDHAGNNSRCIGRMEWSCCSKIVGCKKIATKALTSYVGEEEAATNLLLCQKTTGSDRVVCFLEFYFIFESRVATASNNSFFSQNVCLMMLGLLLFCLWGCSCMA